MEWDRAPNLGAISSPLPYQLRLALREQGLSHGPAVAARLARRAYVGRVRRARASMYGRSTDGIVTLPSVSWPVSSNPISAPPTARPGPVRGGEESALPPPA